MNTLTPALPFNACSAEEPVSPLVAPRMFSSLPCFASTLSKRLPSSCIAMSLKASVGPLEQASRYSSRPRGLSGVISGVPKTSFV